MLYKAASGVFMVTTTIFASLYFVEKSAQSQAIIIETTKNTKEKSTDNKNSRSLKQPEKEVITKTKTVVLKEKISSHPELSSHEIDLMLEIKNSMSRDHSRRLEREHPMLFQRLDLDDEMKKNFKLLVGERRLGLNMRAPEDFSEEEREEYYAKKEEILSSIDEKIAGLLGGQFDSYINYRDKSQQYQVVSSINYRLNESGEALEIDQQDKLAQLMYDSRQTASEEHGQVDWRAMRENPEKAQSALEDYKARQDALKEQVDFLSENQRKAFVTHLDSRYKRYEGWVKRITEGRDRRR